MAVYDGKTQERVDPGQELIPVETAEPFNKAAVTMITEKVSQGMSVQKAFMEVGTIFPQIYDRRIALPAVVFQAGIGDAAIKGVTTDERHLT